MIDGQIRIKLKDIRIHAQAKLRPRRTRRYIHDSINKGGIARGTRYSYGGKLIVIATILLLVSFIYTIFLLNSIIYNDDVL